MRPNNYQRGTGGFGVHLPKRPERAPLHDRVDLMKKVGGLFAATAFFTVAFWLATGGVTTEACNPASTSETNLLKAHLGAKLTNAYTVAVGEGNDAQILAAWDGQQVLLWLTTVLDGQPGILIPLNDAAVRVTPSFPGIDPGKAQELAESRPAGIVTTCATPTAGKG